VSQRSLTELRKNVLDKYKSADSHSKILGLVTAFLRFLATTHSQPQYQSVAPCLERPKTVKVRKNITDRIVTKEDIENVLRHIKSAEERGAISGEHSAKLSAFVILGAFTGQLAAFEA